MHHPATRDWRLDQLRLAARIMVTGRRQLTAMMAIDGRAARLTKLLSHVSMRYGEDPGGGIYEPFVQSDKYSPVAPLAEVLEQSFKTIAFYVESLEVAGPQVIAAGARDLTRPKAVDTYDQRSSHYVVGSQTDVLELGEALGHAFNPADRRVQFKVPAVA